MAETMTSEKKPEDLPTLATVEREHIERVLTAVAGNKTRAALILDVDRKTLHRKLAQYARALASSQGNHQMDAPCGICHAATHDCRECGSPLIRSHDAVNLVRHARRHPVRVPGCHDCGLIAVVTKESVDGA